MTTLKLLRNRIPIAASSTMIAEINRPTNRDHHGGCSTCNHIEHHGHPVDGTSVDMGGEMSSSNSKRALGV